MRKIAVVMIATALFAGCENADKKIPQIADDFCGCFRDMERDLSSQTKDIVHKAAIAENPESVMKSEVEKLATDDQLKVGQEMMSFGEMQDKSSKVGVCMDDVAKKYDKARTMNEKKFLKDLVKELRNKKGCQLTADLMEIGLKSQD